MIIHIILSIYNILIRINMIVIITITMQLITHRSIDIHHEYIYRYIYLGIIAPPIRLQSKIGNVQTINR